MHRREFVAGIAGSGTLGIAGCSTSDDTGIGVPSASTRATTIRWRTKQSETSYS